jgi:hypothetical protein
MPFNPNKYKLELPSDAPKYLLELTTQLRNQALDISRAMASSTGTTLIISGTGGTTSSSTSSSTGGTSTSNVKSGTKFVSAGVADFVPFPTTFTTAPSVVFCAIAGTDGSFGLINTQNLTVATTGFSIPANDIMVSGNVFFIAHVN